MSGFAAIFRFDGAPADGEALGRMVDAIAYRGPDGVARWSGGGAALAHLMLRTTAESLEETQPLANEDESLVLVMDGWLANYDELRSDLLARGCRLRSRSDAELVLRAFETWGDACPRHIDGEYAFVIWDARRREAFCAKDHAAMRPLHYHWDGKRLLVASDVAAVLAAGDFEHRPNRRMIAEHLANESYTQDETLWEGVLRVRLAHTMRVGAGKQRFDRYWMPPLEVTLRYARDEDYQAHYRDLFDDCVRRASRSHKPLACDVSGGLDSSAIFAVAHRLLRENRLQAPGLAGYTLDFGDHAPADIDELEYARAVGAFLSREVREIPAFMPDLDWFWERGAADRDLPPHPNTATVMSIGQALVDDGSVVSLNGEGGDEFVGCSPYNYAEHLKEADWQSLRHSLREDIGAFGLKWTARTLLEYGVRPLVPGSLKALRRRVWHPTPETPARGLLTPELLELIEQRRRSLIESPEIAIENPARNLMFRTLERGYGHYSRDFSSRQSSRLGFEARSPMYARAFIEFAFAIPDRQRRRGDIQKFIHVRGLSADFPKVVAERKTKAHFFYPFTRQLDKARDSMIPPMLQCGMEWVHPAALEKFYVKYDREPLKPVYAAWAVHALSSLFGPSSGKTFAKRD